MVMVVVPVPVTWPPVTSMVSTVASSAVLFRVMLPLPTTTVSSKVSTRLAVVATAVASSAGERVDTAGAVVSGSSKAPMSMVPISRVPPR